MSNMIQKNKIYFSIFTLLFLFACSKPDYELFEGPKETKVTFLGNG